MRIFTANRWLAYRLHHGAAMIQVSERAKRVVLLVEHDAETLMLAGEALRNADYEVVTAQSAAEARERIEAFSPDLMLMDAKLPEADGFLLERRFASGRQMPPVVFLSSTESFEDLRRGYEHGVLSHIFKGAGVQRLPEMLDSAFERLEFEGGPD